ncbi:RICIN domain-containing protein [Paenibacillus pasadenensis]|uniref:RICIN domain-containing protein n=1 Tax=Paenibacillus pasadenensis TaxID=217090 RepID=UPI00203E0CB4|nr:RICIN domain-containing protein [Paenibacillus pasadenensis]MCM3750280.1 RICIN domain-containing protein [Paenibacillus pasadenensis]
MNNKRILSAAPVSVSNGVQFTDLDNNLVQAHAGAVLKEGNYYYWFGENRTETSDNQYYVSVYRSTDLKNWEFRNHVLTRNSAPELALAYIERPKVIYNSTTNKYVMWMHKENGINYSEGRVAVAYSDTIDGDYTYTGSFQPTVNGVAYDSRDMTLFQDDNGDAYLFSSSSSPTKPDSWNSTMNIFKLTDDYMNVDSKVNTIFEGLYREAPAIFKRNGVYFMLSSTTSGWNANQQRYATTTDFAGEWSTNTDVGNSNNYDSQTGFVLPVRDSSNNVVSYLYMGDRWGPSWGGGVPQSKYVWAPIVFTSNTSFTYSYYDNLTIDTAAGTVTGSDNAWDFNGYYTMTNLNSGLALSIQGTAEGANAEQAAPKNDGSQLWKLVSAESSNDYFYIVNQASNKYLSLNGDSLDNGVQVILAAPDNQENQQWQINKSDNGTYTLINRKTKSYLDVQNQSQLAGTPLVQWLQTAGASQEWSIALR